MSPQAALIFPAFSKKYLMFIRRNGSSPLGRLPAPVTCRRSTALARFSTRALSLSSFLTNSGFFQSSGVPFKVRCFAPDHSQIFWFAFLASCHPKDLALMFASSSWLRSAQVSKSSRASSFEPLLVGVFVTELKNLGVSSNVLEVGVQIPRKSPVAVNGLNDD
jgi:hypothetical protein